MTKAFYLLSFALFIGFVNSAASPRVDSNGIMYVSTIPDWACTITFNYRGTPLYTESLSIYYQYKDNNYLSNENVIDSISWAGSSCYCWVYVFERYYFEKQSLGVWIGSTSGSIDLTNYNLLDDGDLIEDDYNQWSNDVSSYRIYCF